MISAEDATNIEYGFDPGMNTNDTKRICDGTLYAITNGVLVYSYHSKGGPCSWWIRSPGEYTTHAGYVYCFGYVDPRGNDICDVSCGVRPALYIDLK